MNQPVILGWGRSAVAPVGGAFSHLAAHEIGAPVLQGLLARFGIPAAAVDAVVAGNALGAGGNPARMLALAAGLPDRTAALSVDTQCCAGLDAVTLAAALLHSGSAAVVVAGGLEAWSRAPIRQHRPRTPQESPQTYERPAFAPDAKRDPDMLLAAARYAARFGIRRDQQDAFAAQSHARALALRARMAQEIIVVGGATEDSYARRLSPERMARMPVAALTDEGGEPLDTAVSRIAVAPRADGAAFVVLATRQAAEALGLVPHFRWCVGVSVGGAPEMPMLAAVDATRAALARSGDSVDSLWGIELHEAFAVQALAFIEALGVDCARLNRGGGGLGRGHPIGASGAISLVRLLSDMHHDAEVGARGLAVIAGAGGIGAAAVVERI
ncbi:MAG: acetyl-CoA acetyltransferase [Rhizobacter sp.]|nr:acetyl-CoA acetyltransferase [Rhizobacter sp.]